MRFQFNVHLLNDSSCRAPQQNIPKLTPTNRHFFSKSATVLAFDRKDSPLLPPPLWIVLFYLSGKSSSGQTIN